MSAEVEGMVKNRTPKKMSKGWSTQKKSQKSSWSPSRVLPAQA